MVDNQLLLVTAFGYTSAVGTTIMDQVAVLGEQVCVELGKFDPPLWHAPYGCIV